MRWTLPVAFSLLLVVIGALFYLYMGASFSRWTDIGVYTVSITMLGFGLFGLLLSRWTPEANEP